MDFGFMNVSAPPSQPAPLTDASLSAGAPGDAAAAFDAALAATLGPTDAQATPATGAAAKIAQPAWVLAQFFAPAATSADVATSEATIVPGGGAVPDELTGTDGVTVDDESSDELAAAADLVVPMPATAEVKSPVVLQGGAVAAGDDTIFGGNQTTPAPAAQVPVPAALDGDNARMRASADVVHTGKSAAPADAPVQTANRTASIAGAPATAADTAAAGMMPGTVGIDAMSGAGEPSALAEVTVGSAADRREVSAPATPMPRTELAPAAAPSSEAAQHGTAAASAVANAIAAVAEQAGSTTDAASGAARTESAESGAAARQAMSWQAHAGHDAPMTGQEQQGQSQGRPSPEFTRFAAALAQVTSAGTEDGGRAAGPVAPPVAPAAAPAAAPAHAAAATAAAAPQTTTQTPEAESLGRLVQAMRVISRPGAWEANVRLKPEHLGDVNIAVRVERNTVSAVVNAEAAGVRQWLESQEQAVRSGMAEHGLHLERFVVQRDGQRRDAEPQHHQESPRQRSRRPASTTERFEIVV